MIEELIRNEQRVILYFSGVEGKYYDGVITAFDSRNGFIEFSAFDESTQATYIIPLSSIHSIRVGDR